MIFLLETQIPESILGFLSENEIEYLEKTFKRFGGEYPSLEQIWWLMDEVWNEYRCDPNVMDERVGKFYMHPVWLLNGLFIEQHDQSQEHRRKFAKWVQDLSPKRMADFGGGFGGLARIIGEICPATEIEVIEPHPRPSAIAMAELTNNVRYCNQLTGKYDILVATDVFEHVPDPLALLAETASSLRPGGMYLIANCFAPVIHCHLPQTFHFRHTWDAAMKAIGLKPVETVSYGRAYVYSGELNLNAARIVEHKSRIVFKWTSYLPMRVGRPFAQFFFRQERGN